MNPKFFDVKKEKQDAIINAALKVFAENGYRKASTDVIVKEAGISKGLLFHYFISKSGVYEFIYDYSVKYMTLELTNAVNRKETDFFAIQRMIEACKTRVMKNYPYMQQFLTGAKYETHPDALKALNASGKGIEDAYNAIYKKVDMTRFPKDVDLDKVIRMIGWMSDGYIKDKCMDGTPDLDEMNAEFAGYLAMLRGRFYGRTVEEAAPEEEAIDMTDAVRDDSVMDSMRETTVSRLMEEKTEELSFEERLERGKRSAYDEGPGVTEEETAAEEMPVSEEVPADADQAVSEEADGREAEAAKEKEKEEKKTFSIEDEPETESSVPEIKVSDKPENEKEEDGLKEDTEETVIAASESEEALTEEIAEESTEPLDITSEEAEAVAEETVEDTQEITENRKSSKDKKKNKKTEKASGTKDREMREVTISIDDFSDAFKSYDTYTYGGKGTLYAASGAVKTYIPDFKVIQFYETSRLDDFTYGSDSRGGRGIPYDSSDNIQIFVEEDDEDDYDYPDYSDEPVKEEAPGSEQVSMIQGRGADASNNDDLDIDGLTDKIMTNTEKESAEFDRARELSEMGPAPVLPDFSPEKLRRMNDNVGDEDDENSHLYRPVNF